jgi:putative methyltransferase (TIGR04325 family)
VNRALIRDLVPPIVARWLIRAVRGDPFSHDYGSWEAAAAASQGYSTDLQIYGAQAERVRQGEESPMDFFTALAGVLLAGETARVLDFGGGVALGYLRLMRAAPERIEWWRIVDLPPVVSWGRAHVADGRLAYFNSIEDAVPAGASGPNVLLCCSVLHYFPDPYATLAGLLALKPRVVILDRIPLHPREAYYVQTWPKSLGGGSAPRRQIVAAELDAAMHEYELIGERDLRPPDPNSKTERGVVRLYRRKP